jgi:amino acid adenylation domain-containing protein/non-ribosomal peptide synthase protein (TIGR01720 family)
MKNPNNPKAPIIYPLSYSQQALWFIYREAPESAAYNMALPLELAKNIDPVILQQAVQKLVDYHPTLRTCFGEHDGVPYQQFAAEINDYWQEINTAEPTESELITQVQQAFVLEKGVFRATLFQRANGKTILLLTLHHIAGDAASLAILGQQLLQFYAAVADGKAVSLPPLVADYSDYVRWETEQLHSNKGQRMAAYWQKQLAGEVPILQLPTDFPRPPVQTFNGASVTIKLSTKLTRGLSTLAKARQSTLFTVLLSAYQVVLHRYSGQPDIWVGVPTSIPRNQPEFSEIVGYLVNPMIVRTQFPDDHDLTFSHLTQQIGRQMLTGLYHQPYPFAKLIEQLQPQRDLSYPPLVQVMFALERHDLIPKRFSADNYYAQRRNIAQMEGQFDLSLTWFEDVDGKPLSGVLSYNSDLFKPATMARMTEHLQILLKAAVSDAEQNIKQLSLLTESEKAQLIQWNQTKTAYPKNLTLIALFEQQVAQTPDNVAVVFEDEQLTYRLLNKKANQLAHHLLAHPALKAVHNPLIAICIERSLEMIIGLLGILKAGGAYVPIDPDYPAARIDYMLNDSAVPVLLTQSTLKTQLPDTKAALVCLDEFDFVSLAQGNPSLQSQPNDLAYVIYTSGSTGKPKGSAIYHSGLVNLLGWYGKAISLSPKDKTLIISALGFDLTQKNLFAPLMVGASIYVPNLVQYEPSRLVELIAQAHITWINCAPSAFYPLLETSRALDWQPLSSLRWVILGGEPIQMKLLKDWLNHAKGKSTLINSYGPTECTDVSSAYVVAETDTVPIGHPIANTRIYILDNRHRLLPQGIPGELCIAGDGVARGYLNRPKLTAEKFIEVELFGKKERIYKTGDLARWLPDGNLEFLGRIDNQVKIRGFRIELGEIEAVLAQHDTVKDVAVIVHQTDNNKRLVAYVTVNNKQLITELRDWLKTRLPDYMVPSAFVTLDTLPLTPNGKIDRRALEPLSVDSYHLSEKDFVAPRTAEEELLANIWAKVLGIERVGIYDNFFELGGHSLLATQIVARIHEIFGIELSIRTLFDKPQFAALAEAIQISKNDVQLSSPIMVQGYPLTSPQREIWFDQMLHETVPLYNIGGYVKIPGRIDPALFEQAINLLIQKHDALRTILTDTKDDDGLPLQAFMKTLSVSVPVQDFSKKDDTEQAALDWMRKRFYQPFQLHGKPLFRYDLVKTADDCYYWLMQYHHIIADGYTVALLHRSLANLYTQLAQGQTPDLASLSYTHYISDDRAYVESDKFEQHRHYWLEQYPSVPEPLLKPHYRSHFVDNVIGSGCEAFFLPRDVYRQLNNLAKQQKVTFLHIMLGALYVYFTRIAQRDELALGLPVLNRANAQFKQTAGLFVGVSSTLFNFGQNLNFLELIVKIQQRLKSYYRHQRFPISELNRKVGLDKTGRSALFDINLSYQKFDYDTEFNGITSHFTVLWSTWEQTPLIIHVQDFHAQADVKLDFVYNLAYFTQAEIQALHYRLMTILQTLLTDGSTLIRDFPILTALEIQQLQTCTQTQTDYPKNMTIVALFEQQVAQTPYNVAVVFEEEQLTYQQLNEKSNQLAHHLLAHPALKAVHNPLIAICIERSLEMIIGLLGILKAGGAYVPIDPDYPAARIDYMLNDSAVPVLLTQSTLKTQLPDTKAALVCLDEFDFVSLAQGNPSLQSQPNDLAYVIYTSGSTGKPKGSAIYHSGLVNLLGWYGKAISLSPKDKTLIISALGFDLTQKNLFAPLMVGASIYVPNLVQYEPSRLVELIAQAHITWINCAPSAFYPLLETSRALDWQPLSSLRWVILGGEPIQMKLLKDWLNHAKGKSTLINSYGPTECTDVSSAYVVAETDTVPIGHPIANTRIYILDNRHRLLPQGIPGELCIAGDGVARGYLNRPKLTAEKFIEVELFGKKERIYKTGDLARWLPDGNLEFLGRIDNQVKIRGFRIELGEIEAVLAQHDTVKDVAVIVHQTDNNKRLVAYVTVNNKQLITELRDWLKTRLPDYMVPSAFVTLDTLPLTPNGKIDRRALEPLSVDSYHLSEKDFVAPRTAEEELLANIWAKVLGIERVGIHDNFFKLGGHSLLATQVISQIRDNFNVELSLRTLFNKPELAALAEIVKTAKSRVQLPTITIQPKDEAKVLSFGQEWFWLLSQYDSQSSAHNMFYAWQLSGALDTDILRRVACDIVEHHQSLRLCFPESQGHVTVEILPAYDPLTISDLSNLTTTEHEQQLKTEARQQSQHIFDLKTGPLFKLHLVQLAEQRYVLFMTVHHIIFDGWSSGILLAEFQQRYIAYHQQQDLHLPAPEIQYTDFAAWQRACLQGDVFKKQLDYWINQLQDAPELLKLPTDYPRPEIQHNQGGIVNLQIPKVRLEQLNRLARQHNCSLQMALFSSFVLLLNRYSGQNDICIGVPRVMRHQRQTENIVGLFLNMLVLRTQVSPQASFAELLQQVRLQALDAYAHQDMPFEYLVNHLRPQRSTAYNPYFQVMFNLVNMPDSGELSLPELKMQPWSTGENERAISNLDIVFILQESTTGLDGAILFDKALFKTKTIEYWREGFLHLLEQVVQQADAPLTQFVLSHQATPRYPLTSSQREIWFDQMLHEEIPLYNIGGRVHLPGRIKPQLFKQAVNLLVQKHDTLRTLLLNERDEDGIPLQTYTESLNVDVPVHDFSNAENPEQVALKWMQARFKEPFELIEKPLFRYDLIKTSDDSYYWLLQYHHLIIDGWGVALLNRSLAEIYTQLVNGENPSLNSPSYTGFIENDRNYVESALFEKQRQYWLEKYPAVPEPLLNPRYRAEFNRDLIESGCEELYLSRNFYNQLNILAKQHQATLFHVLLGALYTYFTRTAQRDDFAIGLPVLNRAKAQFKQTAGLFTGVSATWFKCGQDLSFAELLGHIQKTLKANYRHQRFPVSEVNRAIGLEHKRSQLFDINLSYENHDYDAEFDAIKSHFTAMLHGWEQIPLMIFVRDFHAQAEVKFDFVYNLAYFTQAEIQALQNHFVMILQAVLTEPTALIQDLPILTEPEVQQLQTWNRTETDYPKDLTIVALFERQVAQTPDNIAVVFEEKQLSYRQLNEKANQLAHYLLTHSVLKNTHNPLIAICIERSLEMLIALLGILKAGGAYVPITPDYPAERIDYMLKDSAAPVLLTQSKFKAQLPEVNSVIVCLDETDFGSQLTNNLSSQPDDLGYVIYTSGSTGKPKGVALPQQALVNLLNWQQQVPELSRAAITLQFTTLSFDVSFQEIFSTWLNGGQLVLVDDETRRDANALLSYLAAQHIERLFVPFVMLQHLAEHFDVNQHCDLALQNIITAGEQLRITPAIRQLFTALPQCQLHNHYGPSETHVVTALTLPDNHEEWADLPSIGQPIHNNRIYILDNHHQPLPQGIPGELCIAGDNLARGYLNRPELTAEKFIEVELFGKKERIYKTGDLARWLPDGNLEFIGRIDNQIKLRGFRIELGEIEAVLHQAVKETVVILYEADDNKRLVAYLTLKSAKDEFSLIAELKDRLKAQLPEYMIPSQFIILDKLPLTPNGKIDRKALPEPQITPDSDGIITPRSNTETLLASLWSSVLKVDVNSVTTNFFDLGGHSLLATQLASRIRDSFEIDMPLRVLFEHPVLSELASWLDQQQRRDTLPPLEPQPQNTTLYMSYAQQRLWFLDQLEEEASATYNMPLALQLNGKLDQVALQQTFIQLVARHQSLRLCFPQIDGKPVVEVLPAYDPLTVTDLSHLTPDEQQAKIQQLSQAYAVQPFDLAKGPLLRLHLLQLNEQEHILLFNIHHIIFDGWSKNILVREWVALYTAISQGQDAELKPLAIQYTDYAAWQRNWLQGEILQRQLDYWQTQLADAQALLELPTDFPRPVMQSNRGAHLTTRIDSNLAQQLNALSQQQGCTLFMTLLTAFNILLYRYTGQNDLLIGSPIANRTHSQIENLIGFFVNNLVLRTRIPAQIGFNDLLKQVRHTALGAYAHQDIPFEHLVEHLQLERSLSHSPLFQVMFALQNTASVLDLPDLNIQFLPPELPVSSFDLTLSVSESDGDLILFWEYATDLFSDERIQRMAAHFVTLLASIVQQPNADIHRLPLLTETEKQQFIDWNQTQTHYPSNQTVVTLFEQQVAQTPDNLAVVLADESLTYLQLNIKANQLAHELRSHSALKNVHNPLIAICVERSLDMLIGLLGILKAGGAYVPIDPNYPAERIAYMLNDSAAPVLLTQSQLQAQLPKTESAVVYLDEAHFASQAQHNPSLPSQPNDLAYVIYTSGSTGQPKGVQIEHLSLINIYQSWASAYYLNQLHAHLQMASFSFDVFTGDWVRALCSGAKLVLCPREYLLMPEKLYALIEQESIDCGEFVPSVIRPLQAYLHKTGQKLHLSLVIVGSELWYLHEYQKLKVCCANHTRLISSYGVSEATIDSSYFEPTLLPEHLERPVPIGKPLNSIQLWVLDQLDQPQPIGIKGQLCIAGTGLARCYLNRPDLSLEKFMEVKLFGKKQRIYKTGDIARWLPDGNLEYIGRIDQMVKLRGFRIELSEIEDVLSQHPSIKEAVVTLYEGDGNKRLAAYVTMNREQLDKKLTMDTQLITDNGSRITELRDYLKNRLPDYMVPASFTVLDKLPLTINGKIDRQALPEPSIQRHNQFETPRNEVESQLTTIWKNILNQEKISIHDNFFSLGGDSILSIQIVAQARQIGLTFTPRALFEHQTIAELASVVGTEMNIEAEQGLVMGDVLLTPIQYWFFASDFPEYWHYNQSVFLKASLDLSVEALQKAFAAVLTQHDVLRLRYRLREGTWQQRFAEMSETLPFSLEDLSHTTADADTALLQRTKYYQTSLNLSEGPLTRLALFNLRDSVRVFWCIHHLVVDGVSWRILLEDLYTAYHQALTGQTIQLPKKTSSFKAWAQRLSNYAQSETVQQKLFYWQNMPMHPLPVNKPNGQNSLEYTQHYRIEFDAQTTRALLQETTAAYNTHINDILLSALALALQEWTGNNQCTIDLETHGRVDLFKEIDLSRTVGWFTNIHPLNLILPREGDLGATLKTVKAQRQSIPNEGIGYGLLTYLRGKSLPKGNILFNYLGQFEQNAQEGLFSFANETTYSPVSHKGERDHLIEINGMVSQGQLHLTWSFSQDCYHSNTIESLANHYKRHLNNLIQHCQTRVRQQPKLEIALLLRKGHKPALFCIPGLGSKAGYFRALAGQLQTTQSVYGLESPGLTGRYPQTVEALAQQHFEVIRHFQPSGQPYYLLGHSFGAAVGLELAWQLEQAGETVALLAIIDQPALHCTPNTAPLHTTEFDWLGRIVGTFQLLAGIELPFNLNQLKQTGSIQIACEKVMAWLKQHEMHELLFSPQGQTEELLAYVNVYQANETAFLNYSAVNKKLRCAIDLFCTHASEQAWINDNLPDDWGWGTHTDEVRIHQLNGAHFSVFNSPYVQNFAKQLDVQLQNARLNQA